MLADVSALMNELPASTTYAEYEQAIVEQNLLGKPTASTRLWAWKKLRELYALDPSVPVFRVFRQLWDAEQPESKPVLALTAALARDALLRATAPAIISRKLGEPFTREDMQQAIVAVRGDRFTEKTMRSLVSNLMSSWTSSGYLVGRGEKRRARPSITPATTAYALALGYLAGARGSLLFTTLWTSVLDSPESPLHDHAREASRRGWLVYRGVGNIVDVDFPELLTPEERVLANE